MDSLALIVVLTIVTGVFAFYGLFLLASRRRATMADRVEAYAGIEEEAAIDAAHETHQTLVSQLLGLIARRSYIERIEDSLARADVPMRASEYLLARLVLTGLGLVIGFYILGYAHSGIMLAVIGYVSPGVFLIVQQRKRRDKFVRQLADALMLLTNSLRSGYSFLKGLELVAKEMSDPISKELYRTLREVNLGATIEDAMSNLGHRVNSKDLDIVISAYLVQKEVGGNLTEIMQKVAETIRERLRIQGDIKVLTAQGRLSGLFVGLLPIIVGLMIFMVSPEYFQSLFGPPHAEFFRYEIPYGVLLLIAGFCWQMIGAYLIYKIISIKV